jgi:hypothetical protein
MDRIKAVLVKYIPIEAVDKIAEWIVLYKIHLNITKSRSTKAGDYRSPRAPKYIQQITVNHDLNKYSFFITLVHEIAHLKVWNNSKHLKLPHGKEWKDEFGLLLSQFTGRNIFPPELETVVLKYIKNPSASSSSDEVLYKALRQFDEDNDKKTLLDDLSANTIFAIQDGRRFIKGEKLRKRYRCKCLDSKKTYLINGLTEVFEVTNN